jgi:phosphoenolpyruvate phosphomutase
MKKTSYIAIASDVIHPGHLNLINKAAELGSLIIGVLTDKAIASYKRLPSLSFQDRVTMARSIKGVSKVVVQESLDYVQNLEKYRPDYLVHGDEWKIGPQKIIRKRAIEALSLWGGKLIELPYSIKYPDTLRSMPLGIGTPEYRRKSLVRLLEAKNTLRFLDVHNALSGLIVEKAIYENGKMPRMFDGMWASSLTDSTAKGKPDIEAVDPSARLTTLNEIIEVTTKPIIYDADTGGKPEHFAFTVRNLERLGVSAVIIEDKTGLKKNSLLGNEVDQSQDSIEAFSNKINIGKKSQLTEDFLLIARIESLILGKGVEDALIRAEAFIEAGADGIMIHSRMKDPDEIFNFIKRYNKLRIRKPLVCVPSSYNQVLESELSDRGVNIVIYANHLLRSAYPAMMNTALSILEKGRSLECDSSLLSIKEILDLIPGTR